MAAKVLAGTERHVYTRAIRQAARFFRLDTAVVETIAVRITEAHPTRWREAALRFAVQRRQVDTDPALVEAARLRFVGHAYALINRQGGPANQRRRAFTTALGERRLLARNDRNATVVKPVAVQVTEADPARRREAALRFALPRRQVDADTTFVEAARLRTLTRIVDAVAVAVTEADAARRRVAA